jgi:mannose-1-phosphate guanylyltransferase
MSQLPESAMLLAAGFGQRLRPLSLLKPKPLFPVLNKTMLFFWLEKFSFLNLKTVVINVHYLSSAMIEAIEALKPIFHFEIIISYEPNILGTGGGIQAALNHFKTSFYVVNSDIYTTFDLKQLAIFHQSPPWAPASLALCDYPSRATVSLDEKGNILGFRSPKPLPHEFKKAQGTGLMVVEPDFIKTLPPGPSDIILALMDFMSQGAPPKALDINGAFWSDMGTVEDYFLLNKTLVRGQTLIEDKTLFEGLTCGFVLAQKGARVEKGAKIVDSILWPEALVRAGALVKEAVLAGEVRAGETVLGGVVWDK